MKDDRNGKGTIYKKWQYSVFERDNWRCIHCGTEEKLCAHHIVPWNDSIELRYEVSNGLTLCSSCHFKVHHCKKIPWNKGKKMDDEFREKVSIGHKGQKAWNKGMKMSKEFCLKSSQVKLGKKRGPHSEEHKKKIGIANKETLNKYSKMKIGKTWIKCPDTGKRIWIDKDI